VVQRENGTDEDAQLEEGEVIEALSALEPVWDELYPAEQARIMRLLIERIDVAPDDISVTLHAARIRSAVAGLADQEAPALAASDTCWRLQGNEHARRSRGRHFHHPHPDPATAARRSEADHAPEGSAAPARKPSRDDA
jgi:hypothetical protein